MKLDGGEEGLKSWMGSLCSIILATVMLAYMYQKMDVLIARKDVDVLSTINDQYYEDDFIFSYENGLNVAVSFTAYDGEQKWILDPTYGSLIFNSYTWGSREDGSLFAERIKLDQHICQRDELGLDEGDAKFLPINSASRSIVDQY